MRFFRNPLYWAALLSAVLFLIALVLELSLAVIIGLFLLTVATSLALIYQIVQKEGKT